MAEAKSQRLFFALWPGRAERRQLEAYRPLLRGCGGRRVPEENLHLTLAFLGSVEPDTRDCLIAQADRLQLPPFTLTLHQLGFWRRPRVVWLGSEEEPPELIELVSGLRAAMRECGLEPERRSFSPHLTLLRKAHRAPRQREVGALEWPVERFVLAASETRPEGAHYRILREWGLGSNHEC